MNSPFASHWTLDAGVRHLNHGSFGAAPRLVLEAQQRWRDLLEANPDTFMLEHYPIALEYARARLADFVNADPDGMVLVTNATTGVNAVLRSLEAQLQPGDEIVVTDHTYNACRNAALVTAERTGARIVTARLPFPVGSPDDISRAVLDAVSADTRLVIIDAITSPTGLVLPFEEIVRELEPEVPVLLDAAHAPGMIEFDVTSIGASYVTANCHKWICAPKGAAFLAVAPAHRDATFAPVISHGYNGGWPGSDARLHQQFDWTGTHDPTAWFAIPDAIDVMQSVHTDGWPGVRRDNHQLCLAGRALLLDALEIDAPAPESMIGSIASVPIPDPLEASDDIFDPLMIALRRQHQIEVPVFAWPEPPQRLLRISAQLYNSLDEYEALASAVLSELYTSH